MQFDSEDFKVLFLKVLKANHTHLEDHDLFKIATIGLPHRDALGNRRSHSLPCHPAKVLLRSTEWEGNTHSRDFPEDASSMTRGVVVGEKPFPSLVTLQGSCREAPNGQETPTAETFQKMLPA